MAVCGSCGGAAVCANKIPGIRAGLIHDHYSGRQGLEEDHVNILCIGSRIVGPVVAQDLVDAFLAAPVQPGRTAPPPARQGAALKSQVVS
jgi:ribose 5-phosphate isomerase B